MAEYKMCFEIFRQYAQYITGVTFWNVSDRSSWLDNFPVRNRKDYSLLFDRNLQPKAAYRAVVQVAADSSSARETPGGATFVNPVLPGDHPDPTLLKVGDDFYLP